MTTSLPVYAAGRGKCLYNPFRLYAGRLEKPSGMRYDAVGLTRTGRQASRGKDRRRLNLCIGEDMDVDWL